MKKLLWLILFTLPVIAATPSLDYQHFDGLKIGDKSYPVGSSIFEAKSTTLGFLIPRMTSTQRLAIATPVDGMLVFDTTIETVMEYNGTLSQWTLLVSSSGGSPLGNNLAVATNGSGALTSSTTTATQLGYLSELTAAGGDVIISDSTGIKGLAGGSSTYVLQANGVSSSPSWVAVAANATLAATATNANNVATTNTSTNGNFTLYLGSTTSPTNQSVYTESGMNFNPSTNVLSTTTFSGNLSGNISTSNIATNSTFYPSFVSTLNGTSSIDTVSGLTFNPSTDILTTTTFSGALSGNATTSTNATNAANGAMTNTVTNATFYPVFSPALNGNNQMDVVSGLSFNPSTDILTTTTFSGALSGNATTSTSSTNATNSTNLTMNQSATNAIYYPFLATGSTDGNQPAVISTGFSINPSTDVVTATTFSGNATTATTATNATNSATTKQTGSATYYIDMFSSSGGGNQGANFATGLTFNPSTDILTATTFSGNATTSTTATNATNVGTTSVSTSTDWYPLMVASTSNSNQAASLMTGFTFNPGMDTLVAGNLVTEFSTGVSAAGTWTLTNTSPGQDVVTGSTTQTIKLPAVSTLYLGQSYFIINNSSGNVTVQSSGGNSIQVMAGTTFALFTCISQTGTTNASWSVEYTPPAGTPTFSGLTQWGAMYASNATTILSTAAGAAGDVLLANSGAAPSWNTGTKSHSCHYTLSGSTTPGANTIFKFDTVDFDVDSAYSVSTGLFTAAFPGYYLIDITANTNGAVEVYLKKNGSQYPGAGVSFVNIGSTDYGSGSMLIHLNAGDTVGLYPTTGSGFGSADTNLNIFMVGQ